MNDSGWSLLDLFKRRFPYLNAQDVSPSFEQQLKNRFVQPIQDPSKRIEYRMQLDNIFRQNPNLILDYIYKDNLQRHLKQQQLKKWT